jgi:hypothetical protein
MPGTARSCGFTTKSWISFSSMSCSARVAGLLVASGSVVHDIVEDVAQPGGDGREFGGQAGRQFIGGVLQTLADQLARAVDVGPAKTSVTCERPVLESERSSVMPGTPLISISMRKGDEFLDLLGGEALDLRVDLDLDVGDVGCGVDGQAQSGPDTGASRRASPAPRRRAGAGKTPIILSIMLESKGWISGCVRRPW